MADSDTVSFRMYLSNLPIYLLVAALRLIFWNFQYFDLFTVFETLLVLLPQTEMKLYCFLLPQAF